MQERAGGVRERAGVCCVALVRAGRRQCGPERRGREGDGAGALQLARSHAPGAASSLAACPFSRENKQKLPVGAVFVYVGRCLEPFGLPVFT